MGTVRDWLRHMIERLIPWYDPAAEARRQARTEAIRRRSIEARIAAEDVRWAYAAYARRVRK